jgi:hypothetical protein
MMSVYPIFININRIALLCTENSNANKHLLSSLPLISLFDMRASSADLITAALIVGPPAIAAAGSSIIALTSRTDFTLPLLATVIAMAGTTTGIRRMKNAVTDNDSAIVAMFDKGTAYIGGAMKGTAAAMGIGLATFNLSGDTPRPQQPIAISSYPAVFPEYSKK